MTRKLILLLLFNFFTLLCIAQKEVSRLYSGGHGCVDHSLRLYTDSTYEYKTSTALLFPHSSATKGYYLIDDSSLTLFRRKKMSFLYFSKDDKYSPTTFRIRNKDILMYSEKDEFSKDSSFIKAYQTMWLVKDAGK